MYRLLLARSARNVFGKTHKSLKRGSNSSYGSLCVANTSSSDEYCPHCDNHFVLDAITPQPGVKVEGEDARIDARMLRDDRVRSEEQRSIFNVKDAPERLG